MRIETPLLLIVAGVAASLIGLPACASETMPSPALAPSGQVVEVPVSVIDTIRQAPDPSAAIDAYAKGVAASPDSEALREAFIQRMIDFGVPAMAESQARDLLKHHPNNGLAWGVLAYSNAARGQLLAAISDIGSAVDSLPNNEFIQRTAGQLLAWYDTVADVPKVPDSLKLTVQRLKKGLADKAAFNQTYQEALAFYKAQQAQVPTTQPTVTQGQGQAYSTEPPQSTTYQVYNYAAPYEPYGYGYGYGYWPSSYYGYGYWPSSYYGGWYYGGPYYGYCSWWPDSCLYSSCVPFLGFHSGLHHHDGFFGFHDGFHGRDGFFGFGHRGFSGLSPSSFGFVNRGFSGLSPSSFGFVGGGRGDFIFSHLGQGRVMQWGGPGRVMNWGSNPLATFGHRVVIPGQVFGSAGHATGSSAGTGFRGYRSPGLGSRGYSPSIHQSFGSHSFGSRSFGNRSFGGPFSSHSFGNRSFGSRSFGSSFGGHSFGSRSFGGSFGGRSYGGFGGHSLGGFGGHSFGGGHMGGGRR